jgi:hypothetical protein
MRETVYSKLPRVSFELQQHNLPLYDVLYSLCLL